MIKHTDLEASGMSRSVVHYFVFPTLVNSLLLSLILSDGLEIFQIMPGKRMKTLDRSLVSWLETLVYDDANY